MRLRTRNLIVALLLAICTVIAVASIGTNKSSARQSGGWGCDEDRAFHCESVGSQAQANCLAAGGSETQCRNQGKSAKCACFTGSGAGWSCPAAEDCLQNLVSR